MPGLGRRARAAPTPLVPRWQLSIDDYVGALVWSPDGRWLAAAATSGPITVIDAERAACVARLAGHAPGTAVLSWHPRQALLASGGQDGRVRLWAMPAGPEVNALEGGAAWVERVAWSPAGDLLATAAGRVLRLWDARGALVQTWSDHPSTIADLQWRPGGRELAAAVYGGVIVHDVDRPLEPRHFAWKGSSLALAWSPTGRHLATGEQDRTVHFWDVETGRDLQMWGYETKVLQLAWNHTGRYLATGGSAIVVIWDCSGNGPEGSRPRMLKGHRAPVSALAYQPDGPRLASGDRAGGVRLWQPDKIKQEPFGAQLESGITQIVWAPDGRRFAVGSEAGVIAVFEAS